MRKWIIVLVLLQTLCLTALLIADSFRLNRMREKQHLLMDQLASWQTVAHTAQNQLHQEETNCVNSLEAQERLMQSLDTSIHEYDQLKNLYDEKP